VDEADFQDGLLLGLLIGEGHFGLSHGLPQVVVGMDVRHEPLLRWLTRRVPRSRLYGPYAHRGRHFFRWVARGVCIDLELAPILDSLPWDSIDPHSYGRYQFM
jgi:hypothetical protein